MKTFLISAITILGLTYAVFAGAKHFWRGETLSRPKVCEKWGEDVFNADKFKSSAEAIRAKMACSLLKNQRQFIGKDRATIRKDLGNYDGFYFSDMFPAYMIETAKTDGQDSWQIVFLLNKDESVSEVIVHKNCCER